MNTPFLPAPPVRCSCGAPLEMEMEHDQNLCVQCQYEHAIGIKPPTLHPIFAGLCQPFLGTKRSA